VPIEFVTNEAVNEEMDYSLVRATTTATSLDAEQDRDDELKRTKTAQQTKIAGLDRRVKKLEKKQSTQENIVQDEGIEDVSEEEVVEVVTTAKMIIDIIFNDAQVTIAIADIPISVVKIIVTT
nr:hypothetical protein [Tanacetum cinerariifolium]